MSMGAGDSQDDGVWMMASSFTIFTMTAGFGLLESGRVSPKDEVNVMVKNVVDVIFGGASRGWAFRLGGNFVPETATTSFQGPKSQTN
ncbi:hypothetical protein TELCIR_08419 [Teladorsagia circumcincta]|uniref:Ammonium transporter AmtB-like domain-containing protein n=1 Tax=Teladorsagia circumcincta TaxID=45464 RepID=A0A2G9UJR5_TELCI|nr:hypothetical protein TELCIR_08419 [Teladorsagia circumcincta]